MPQKRSYTAKRELGFFLQWQLMISWNALLCGSPYSGRIRPTEWWDPSVCPSSSGP